MKRLLLTMALAVCCAVSLLAQTKNITVSGRVMDGELNEPIIQASVQLLALPDSSTVAGVATKTDGRFTLPKVAAGKYLLKVSYIGMENKFVPLQLAAQTPRRNLGDIVLQSGVVMLEGAVITAKAPPMVVKGDTTEFLASAYPVPEGSMLEDLVKKIPGVEVDDEGTITLNGKEIKKIMVDGKEFFSDDPSMSMKNLPVDIIDRVKAYDKQSDQARFTGIDDGEEEPVLDLKIKKGMKQGWLGNLIAGYGGQERYEAGGLVSRFKDDASIAIVGSANNTNNRGFREFGDAGQGMSSGRAGAGLTDAQSLGINFNKETKTIKMEGNVQYGHSKNDARRKSSSETFLGDESSFENSTNNSLRDRHDARMDVRFEWRPDTMTTFVFRPNDSYSHTETSSDSWSETLNNSRNAINESTSSSTYKGHNWSLNGNLMFFRRLNSKGRNIHVGANFGYSDNVSDSYSDTYSTFFEYEPDSISDLERYTDRNSDSRNWSVSASYTEPIFKNHFLQLRYSFSHRKQLSQSLVYDSINYDGRTNKDYDNDLSSRVENFYDTHTAEVSIRGVYPKLMYNIGVAATPQSSLSKTTIGPNYKQNLPEQNVLNWAPSMMLRYKFSEQHVLTMRYRGRSSAPSVEDLQEVIDITDPMNMRYGNPNLKPSFSNNFNLDYRRNFEGKTSGYFGNMSFSNTINGVTNRMTYNPETGGRVYRRENVNGNWSVRASFGFNTPFKNDKFSIFTHTNMRLNDAVSYTSVAGNANADQVLSTTHELQVGQFARARYSTEQVEISLQGRFSYGLVRNNKQASSNRQTFDYTIGPNMQFNLPWDIQLATDLNATFRDGYSGDANKNEVMWNAQISKSFLKNNAAMVRVKIYDILQQQNNVSRNVTETMMSDTEYNTLGSYFMVHFVYRFNTFGKGQGGGPRGGEGRPGGGFRGGPGGFRGGPGGFHGGPRG